MTTFDKLMSLSAQEGPTSQTKMPSRMRAPHQTRFFAFILLLYIPFATSSFGADYHSPRISALAGAGHAGPVLNDALYLNPSFASFTNSYSVQLGYQGYSAPENTSTPDVHGNIWNVSVQDGRTPLFQAGVGYTQRTDGRLVHISGSKNIISQLGIGAATKFVLPRDAYDLAVDGTLSVTGIAWDWLTVVGILDNVIQSETIKQRGFLREATVGVKVNLKNLLTLYVDPQWTPDLVGREFGYSAAVEVTLYPDLYLRAGMGRNTRYPLLTNGVGSGYGSAWGVGLGWMAPKLSLDYAFTRVHDPAVVSAHTFGMSIFF